jgi:hypothetical protein
VDPRSNPGTTGFREFGDQHRGQQGTTSGASGAGTSSDARGTTGTSSGSSASGTAPDGQRSVDPRTNPGTTGFREFGDQHRNQQGVTGTSDTGTTSGSTGAGTTSTTSGTGTTSGSATGTTSTTSGMGTTSGSATGTASAPGSQRSADPRTNPGTTGFREFGDQNRNQPATSARDAATRSSAGAGTTRASDPERASGHGTPGWNARGAQYDADARASHMDGLDMNRRDHTGVQPGAAETRVWMGPESDNAQGR